jgi:RNA polymerase sigma-70 factor (ECF subfamily)
MTSDGGGKVNAVWRPLHGAGRIAWLWFAVARRLAKQIERRIVRVNGESGVALFIDGRLYSVSASRPTASVSTPTTRSQIPTS